MIIARYEGPAPIAPAIKAQVKHCERCDCVVFGRPLCARYCHPCADIARQMVRARYKAKEYYMGRKLHP